MNNDFATGESERLSLSGEQFIDIKKRLSTGEREDMYARMMPDGQTTNRREVRTAKVLTYLLGWSLMNQGKPVPMSPEIPEKDRNDYIRALDPDRFDEIYRAIEAHEDAMQQARDAQKKILAGSPSGDATSSSPSAPAGASSGSAPSTLTTTPSPASC